MKILNSINGKKIIILVMVVEPNIEKRLNFYLKLKSILLKASIIMRINENLLCNRFKHSKLYREKNSKFTLIQQLLNSIFKNYITTIRDKLTL